MRDNKAAKKLIQAFHEP